MEHLDRRVLDELFATQMRTRLGQSQKQLQLIAADDIGEAAAQIFLHLEKRGYGKNIDILRKQCLLLKDPKTWLESI